MGNDNLLSVSAYTQLIIKGIVHPKIQILLFSHPQVVPKIIFFFRLNAKEDILMLWKMSWDSMSGYQHSSKYLLLCSTEERDSEVWNNCSVK